MEPITRENLPQFTKQMKEFSEWLTTWHDEYPDYCVSYPTYEALKQTVSASVELCHYLLENGDESGISYVMLGILQQDFLEGRFGWYRQLSGANYFCQVLQFLQAEKSIRLRNLVDSGYNMKDIAQIFSKVNDEESVETKRECEEVLEMLCDFRFASGDSDNAPITYYIAGYISRGLIKKTKCVDCQQLFSDNGEQLIVTIAEEVATAKELEAGKSFLDAINRGGLIKPSHLVFVTCLHATELFKFMQKDGNLKKRLLTSRNARQLFQETLLGKLEEDSATNSILITACRMKHHFKSHAKHIGGVMFNLFAKNMASELNDAIHKQRKREGPSPENEKRDSSCMKAKKLKP